MKKVVLSFVVLLYFIVFNPSFAINNKTAKHKNVEIVQDLYAASANGDVPGVLKYFASNIEWNEAENFPYADRNPYIGSQAVLEGVFARIAAECEYWNLTEQTYYEVNSGEIIVTGRYKAKNKMTGKEINVQFVHMWTLEDGLATKFQQYADTYQTVKAMEVEK